LFIWIPDQVGNDKPARIDSSKNLNLSCFFVIVGLDPTIQKFLDSFTKDYIRNFYFLKTLLYFLDG